MRFDEFDLEDHRSCDYDYFEARDGFTATSTLVCFELTNRNII